MCQLTGVSRASYYRHLEEKAPDEAEMAFRVTIQEIAVGHRRYGYRRITAELHRRGMVVNHKRVLRIMREDNLLVLRSRKFIFTTDSRHEYEVYLNLAARLTVTQINQLWVADITYIRLRGDFVYLAVVIDRFSRKVIGWSLGRKLVAELAVSALQRAITERQPPQGVVHHSDRGVQYACIEYREVMRAHGLVASMSRPANPYDNAFCESFMKTLKHEEVRCQAYQDIDDLAANLMEFIDRYYNRLRLHSALGYRTPEEFEKAAAARAVSEPVMDAASMTYFIPGQQGKAIGANRSPDPAVSGEDQ